MAIDYLIWRFLEWIFPEEDIEIAPAFPYQKYNKVSKYKLMKLIELCLVYLFYIILKIHY